MTSKNVLKIFRMNEFIENINKGWKCIGIKPCEKMEFDTDLIIIRGEFDDSMRDK